MVSGRLMASLGSRRASSAAPAAQVPATRSPAANPLPAGAATTTPAASPPSVYGGVACCWYRPLLRSTSGKLSPTARTRTRTRSASDGSGTSTIRTQSGPVSSVTWSARINLSALNSSASEPCAQFLGFLLGDALAAGIEYHAIAGTGMLGSDLLVADVVQHAPRVALERVAPAAGARQLVQQDVAVGDLERRLTRQEPLVPTRIQHIA